MLARSHSLEFLPKRINAIADACKIGKEDAAQTPPFQPLELNTCRYESYIDNAKLFPCSRRPSSLPS
jgi:hypothetical protein